MKTIYISLPITGYDLHERRDVARRQREKLMAEGWAVVDPLNQQDHIADEASWADHMRYDLKLLLNCDAIYMMDGWHTSRGCATEYLVASDCGIEILGTICTDVEPYIVNTPSLRELPDDRTVDEDDSMIKSVLYALDAVEDEWGDDMSEERCWVESLKDRL